MFNEKDMQEYKEELLANYHSQPKRTYRECEATREWLMREYKDACDLYHREEFTPEQFNDVADLFTVINKWHEEISSIKRDEWSHSSQF